MASTSSSITSVTCSTTNYSNKLAESSITAYCIASIASFSGLKASAFSDDSKAIVPLVLIRVLMPEWSCHLDLT